MGTLLRQLMPQHRGKSGTRADPAIKRALKAHDGSYDRTPTAGEPVIWLRSCQKNIRGPPMLRFRQHSPRSRRIANHFHHEHMMR